MILGNTFTLGAIKEISKGAVPCVFTHMLIDTVSVIILVGSDILPVMILVFIEIILSIWVVNFYHKKIIV